MGYLWCASRCLAFLVCLLLLSFVFLHQCNPTLIVLPSMVGNVLQQNSDNVSIQTEETDFQSCFTSKGLSLWYWAAHHNLAWCKVPKTGSTTWVENFFLLAGQPPPKVDSDVDKAHSRLQKHFPRITKKDFPAMINSSLVFTFVRHPLQRFLSSYRDKIELGNSSYFHSLFGEPEMDFPKFVDLMLAKPVGSWDRHWIPIHLLCPPCASYHVIGRMETFSEDTQYIIARAGLTDILKKKVEQRNRRSTGSLFELNFSYFRQLSPAQLEKLVHVYRKDFELYGYDPKPFQWMADQK